MPGCSDGEAPGDPFSGLGDALPHKYATLPRNRNPFMGGPGGPPGDKEDKKEKKEKVSLLERVTGKKANATGRSGSSGDLRSPNASSPPDANPFVHKGYATSTATF